MSKQIFFKRENGSRVWKQVTKEYINHLEKVLYESKLLKPEETLRSLCVDTTYRILNKKDNKEYIEVTSMEVE